MKRHFRVCIPEGPRGDEILQGVFLVRVDRAYYRWHPQKPFFVLSFPILEPQDLASRKIIGSTLRHLKALWRLNWFLRDFGYDRDLLGRDEVDEKALVGLTGVLRTAKHAFGGRTYLRSCGICTCQRMGIHLEGCSRTACCQRISGDLQPHAD